MPGLTRKDTEGGERSGGLPSRGPGKGNGTRTLGGVVSGVQLYGLHGRDLSRQITDGRPAKARKGPGPGPGYLINHFIGVHFNRD